VILGNAAKALVPKSSDTQHAKKFRTLIAHLGKNWNKELKSTLAKKNARQHILCKNDVGRCTQACLPELHFTQAKFGLL
jgi:hypothetical protein